MAYATVFRHEVTGLREFTAFLKAAGADTGAIKEAMNLSATAVVDEAKRLSPVNTGRMRDSIKANKSASLLRVTVGNNTTTRQASAFHAKEIGISQTGYLTFTVNASGSRAAYHRVVNWPQNPFMFTAAKTKIQQVLDDLTVALDKIAAAHPSGPAVGA